MIFHRHKSLTRWNGRVEMVDRDWLSKKLIS